jgi:Uma2 family endonuclease
MSQSAVFPPEEEIQFPSGDSWSDEPPLESDLHRRQIDLLIRLLEYYWRDQTDFYVSGNLTVYYSPNQRKSEDFRGPDFFAVLGAEKKDRRSWVVWQEGGKYPNIIVELLSDSTALVDRGLKKQIYQDIFRTPDYFWFNPASLEFQGFTLHSGAHEAIEPNELGWLWSQQLGLYLGVRDNQLRFFTSEKHLVLLPEEALSQTVDEERRRADRLAEQIRQMGMEPES